MSPRIAPCDAPSTYMRPAPAPVALPLVDLHAHTNVSDGTLSPRALVQAAKAAGLAAIAVTDHDHVGGLADARAEGALLGVEVIAGIELSAEDEVHLLGYFVEDAHPVFVERLVSLRDARERRGEHIVERLRAAGVSVTMEQVRAHVAPGAALGRPHVARALVDAGVVRDIKEAFDRWLGDGRPGFVPKARLSTAEAIALVHDARGVAVLAHPVTLTDWEGTLRRMAAEGLDGVEAAHSKQDHAFSLRVLAVAAELDLAVTGGSDFHGENKPDVGLGSVLVDASVLDALRARRVARHGR